MDKGMTEETASELRAWVRQLTVVNDIDEDIREEVYGHLEDKLLAYLDGQEQLSEGDALLLVKTHFGDTAHLKVLLQEVHHVKGEVSLRRRLAAVILVFLGLAVFVPTLNRAVGLFCIVYLVPPYGEAAVTTPYALVVVKLLILLAQLLTVAVGARMLVLSRHKEEMERCI